MSKFRYGLLGVVGLVLAGCGLPPALMVASYVAQGAIVASGGKTASDYALSAVVRQDCAMWRALRGDSVCRDNPLPDAGTIMLASGEQPGDPIATQDSAAIQLAQVYLNNIGYDAGPLDGVAGPKTQAAVQAFAADIGRQTDRPLTYQDLELLSGQFGAATGEEAPSLVDDSVTTILLAQAHLSYYGYRPGPLNGISSPTTRDAVIHFQRNKGIEPDGKISDGLLVILRQDLATRNAQSIAATPRPEPLRRAATAG